MASEFPLHLLTIYLYDVCMHVWMPSHALIYLLPPYSSSPPPPPFLSFPLLSSSSTSTSTHSASYLFISLLLSTLPCPHPSSLSKSKIGLLEFRRHVRSQYLVRGRPQMSGFSVAVAAALAYNSLKKILRYTGLCMDC